ncbi:hypothetical protein BN946_scf184601.g4 [Trametes cinnabarina]|uniref:Nitric oxide synthase-interacting protein zinc-finger domain-containing protein n=1 Tax=Pycnoporus cinnabarinus TaxID=5643 RepID=A0A060S746_PYCCI|nr:hypothetical protein BN946_scf184601.g4 [Trametes cinnabarina]
MTKHSKNNTASSIFSYAEYKKLDYGTKRQRLGNESMRRFDACALCLQRARDPVACQKGHLFCRECALTDLVTQINDIKRQKVRLEAMKKEAEEERQRVREAARERVLREFEKRQLGLAATSTISTSARAESSEGRGTKRKFDFDASTVDALAREAEEAALRQIEREQAEALKSKLPDFWLPSLTPTYTSNGPPKSLSDVKLQTMCHGGNPAHPLTRKNLILVKWTFDTSSNVPPKSVESTPATEAGDQSVEPKAKAPRDDERPPICPSCKKQLSNNTLMHSTGYAAGGMAETSKRGVAFQG